MSAWIVCETPRPLACTRGEGVVCQATHENAKRRSRRPWGADSSSLGGLLSHQGCLQAKSKSCVHIPSGGRCATFHRNMPHKWRRGLSEDHGKAVCCVWARPIDRGHSDNCPAAQPLQSNPEDNHFSRNCCCMQKGVISAFFRRGEMWRWRVWSPCATLQHPEVQGLEEGLLASMHHPTSGKCSKCFVQWSRFS